VSYLPLPLRSLQQGRWFKLICGASYQHLPAIHNLTLAYALAGADCIDVAADPAVIAIAQQALDLAEQWLPEAGSKGFWGRQRPWLMVSLNDGEDPHFRKAEFDPAACPSDCARPCVRVCPADAIQFGSSQVATTPSSETAASKTPASETPASETPASETPASETLASGVIADRCYGCGRCLPICPVQHIYARSYVSTPGAIAAQVLPLGVDAVEIHTQIGRARDFARLWGAIAPWVEQLQVVSVSCPDGEGLIDYLRSLKRLMQPAPRALIWQTDGRPMSGDIGAGTTHAAIRLGQKVLAAQAAETFPGETAIPTFIQLAGGTNHHTVPKLRQLGLLPEPDSSQAEIEQSSNNFVPIGPLEHSHAQGLNGYSRTIPRETLTFLAGVAYGSYARTWLNPVLACNIQDPVLPAAPPLEDHPDQLWQAVSLADQLIAPLKTRSNQERSRQEPALSPGLGNLSIPP
jgi:Fe-S-cluster-containing hydrogenase component 2